MAVTSGDRGWRDKYEQIVDVLQTEFQETVLKAQEQAEANAAASKAMILKLKEELCQQEEEIEILKTRLKKQSQSGIHRNSTSPSIQSEQPLNIEEIPPQSPENIKMNFFETITCLEVTVKDDNVYHCIVTDGEIKGLKFKLQYDDVNYEYCYTPVNPAKYLIQTDVLFGSFAFPDYMVPKFMMTILDRTCKQLEELDESKDTIN